MTDTQAVAVRQDRLSLATVMAAKYNMEPAPFLNAIRGTVFPKDVQATDAQLAAFLAVANEYGLNPFTREIYAFSNRGGGIVPIVGVDGWLRLANQHPQFDGYDMEFQISQDGKPTSCTVVVYRKDRSHPVQHTEWYDEAFRATEPWKQMPKRMLGNRALVQALRRAFGFAGIYDEDEGQAIINVTDQGQEIERQTLTKAEELKTKLSQVEKAALSEPIKTEPEVTNPPAPPAPEEKLTEADREDFIKALKSHGKSIGANETQVVMAGKRILRDLGYLKSTEVPQSLKPDMLQRANSWDLSGALV